MHFCLNLSSLGRSHFSLDVGLIYCMLPCAVYLTFSSFSASDNIPKADEIRTLIKDVWDTRIAKFRVSADSFVRQQEAHAKVRMTGREACVCSGAVP